MNASQPSILVSCVFPVYNEEQVIPLLLERLNPLENPGYRFEFIFVNDGSRDHTLSLLVDAHHRDPRYKVIHLGRNFGHQIAITAGLQYAQGECVVILDADLQDPPELIPAMLNAWREGADVVYMIRQTRKEPFFKRITYSLFYHLYKKLADIEVPLDAGDFCLLSRPVLNILNAMPERVRFVRGLRSWIGFKHVGIPYQREARAAGSPKYSFVGLMKLALDGLINFSTIPLLISGYLAGITALIAFGLLCWAFMAYWYEYQVPWGWTSMMVSILFLFSIQFTFMAILSQYISCIFLEVKQRPFYTVMQTWGVESLSPNPPIPPIKP